jgi:hypothetical protein
MWNRRKINQVHGRSLVARVTKFTKVTVVAAVAAVAVVAAPAAAYELTWHTIHAGGGTATGGGFELSVTIGQPGTGVASGGSFELASGFWPGALVGAGLSGDCDADGDVDIDDYAQFAACLTGPGTEPAAECDCFDLDGDNDNDLADFARLQIRFTGE